MNDIPEWLPIAAAIHYAAQVLLNLIMESAKRFDLAGKSATLASDIHLEHDLHSGSEARREVLRKFNNSIGDTRTAGNTWLAEMYTDWKLRKETSGL